MTPLEAFERDLALLESIEGLDEITDALHHDVGKYISRTAQNVSPDETLAAPLLSMLVRDLYETYRGQSARVRFVALQAELPEQLRSSPIFEIALARLHAMDALEQSVRAGELHATRSAIRDSLLISRLLTEAARAVRRALEARGEHA